MFQGCFKGASMVFKAFYKGGSGGIFMVFLGVLWVFWGCLKGFTRFLGTKAPLILAQVKKKNKKVSDFADFIVFVK